jgi:hypothetical protein
LEAYGKLTMSTTFHAQGFGGSLLQMRGLAGTSLPCELVADPDAVYLSPSGRRCRVFEVHFTGRRAHLLYDHKDGTPSRSRFGDGFTLARANWHLLRRVA